MLGGAKSAKRVEEGLLSLLSPCWIRDLEVSPSDVEIVFVAILASCVVPLSMFLRTSSQDVLLWGSFFKGHPFSLNCENHVFGKPQSDEVPKVTEGVQPDFWHFWHLAGLRISKTRLLPQGRV